MSTQLVPFGSPSAARRSTPNVLFLIDIRPWLGVTDSYVLEIKQAVLRILLYFYIYVDARFCWSYRLLDTSEISALGNKGSLGLCHSQEFNPEALALFDKALEEAYESTSHGRSSSELPPAQRACIALRRSLTEFRWNWVAAAGMMPSPAKPTASRQLQAPVRLRNHLFIITPLPGSASDLSQFVGKAQQGHSVQAVTPIAHLQHWKKMDAHLDLLHHDLLNDGMWTGILERRAALCWVDLPRQLSHPGALMERSYIHASISATLSAYGGSVLSSDTLLRPHSGVSFASLFRLLRVTVLDPRLGRSLLSKQRKSRMALLENALLRICSSSNSEVWSGKLLLDSEDSSSSVFRECEIKVRRISSVGHRKPSVQSKRDKAIHESSTINFPDDQAFKMLASVPDAKVKACWMGQEKFACLPSSGQSFGIALAAYEQLMSPKRAQGIVIIVSLRASVSDGYPNSTAARGAEENPFVVPSSEVDSTPDEEHQYGIITPVHPGLSILALVRKEHKSAVDELLSSDHPDDMVVGESSCDAALEHWYDNTLDTDVRNYLFDSAKYVGNPMNLAANTLHVWDAQANQERVERQQEMRPATAPSPIPKAPITNLPLDHQQKDSEAVDKRSRALPELLQELKALYLRALYERDMSITCFLERALPSTYRCIEELTDPADAPTQSSDNTNTMTAVLEYVVQQIVRPIPKLEEKYRRLRDALLRNGSLKDDSNISKAERDMLKTWKDGTLAAAVAPKMPDEQRLLAAALATQRIKEAKLQILMLLECLRLAHPEKGILLPCLRHWCEQPTIEPLPKTDSASVHLRKRKSSITTSEDNTKSKRRKASSGRDDTAVNTQEQRVADFRRAVEDLVDHIGIWRAISGVNSADDDLMKTFVEPVLIKYYQSYFPKLVKSLVLRVGGDPDRHKVVPPSPLFKKRSRSDRKGNAKASSNPSSTAPTVKASSRPNAALSSKTKALSTGLITALGKRQIAIGAKTGASAPSSRNVKGRGSEMSKITNAASHTRSTDNAVVVRRASSTLSMKSHSQFGLASRSMSASTDGERRKSQHIVLGSRPSVLERLERARTLDVPEEAAKIFNDRPPLVPSTPTRKSRKSMHTPTHLRGGGSQRKETYALDEFQESNVIDTPCSRKSKRSSSSLFFEGLSVPAYQRSPSVTPTKKRTSRRSSLIHVDESPTSARQNRKSLIHASPSPLLPDTPSVIFPTTDTPTRRSRVSFPRGAGTPTATPGSCKRLQNMLEGFADFDWDEDEDEVLPNTPVKQRR